MLTGPSKVAGEKSASDIVVPLCVSFDRKYGKVLISDLLPYINIFLCQMFLFPTSAISIQDKEGTFTQR